MPTFAASLQVALGTRYELRGQIASGGMARIFEAWDVKHSRAVAVKVGNDPHARAAFRSEVDIVSRLRHPAILPLYDSGEGDGFVYFIMPLVRSPTLGEVLEKEKRLEPEAALRILSDVAGALDCAHGHGVVHRDIKPGNILMESGRAVVTDFGIALTFGLVRSGEEDPSSNAGTVPYMSPEQLLDPGKVGPPSDIYALGCLACELLTGEQPFRAGSPAAAVALKLKGPSAAARSLRSIPGSVRKPILRALSAQSGERPPSAASLVEGIRRGFDRRTWWLRWGSLAASAVVVVALLLQTFFRGGGPTLDGGRVVVGPLVDRTANRRLTSLATSAVDHLTRSLQSANLLSVVPTETALGGARFVMRRMDEGALSDPIAALAEETGAGIVISGEILEDGGRVGVRVRITDATRGVLLSASEAIYVESESPQELTRLIRTVGSQVMGSLAVTLDDRLGESGRAATAPAFEAYRPFSEGLEQYLVGDYRQAIALFRVARDADSTFVAPTMYEALSHSNLGEFAAEDSLLASLVRADAHLTPFERRWLEYRRALLAGNRPAALLAIRSAAAEAPGSKAAYNLGVEAMEGRRLADAVEAFESLPVDRGPMRGFVNHLGALATAHHLLGDFREALDAAVEARRIFPDYLRPRMWEMGALAALGRVDQLRREVAVLATLQRDVTGWEPRDVLVGAAQELMAHGQPEVAREVWQDVVNAASRGNAVPSVRALLAEGEACLALGRLDDARGVAQRLARMDAAGVSGIDALAFRGRVAALAGDREGAERVVAALESMPGPYLFGIHHRGVAMVAAALGDRGRAVAYLRRGFAEGLPYGDWAHNHPAFAPLWDVSEYRAMMAPVR
ncbi:MAG TPA: protein kinase [Longimicrobiales bacterium]|nr:protein kinase [Longimicrobiales bacterium]